MTMSMREDDDDDANDGIGDESATNRNSLVRDMTVRARARHNKNCCHFLARFLDVKRK